MEKIIGLTGFSQSGKSTVANYLKEKYDYELVSLADPIKKILSELYSIPLPLLELEEFKKQRTDKFDGKTYRQALQEIGTAFRNLKKATWVNYTRTKIMKLREQEKKICITDIRYVNEVPLIQEVNGKLICIERKETIPKPVKHTVNLIGTNKFSQCLVSLIDQKLGHESEFNNFRLKRLADITIVNNFQDINDLFLCIDVIVQDLI